MFKEGTHRACAPSETVYRVSLHLRAFGVTRVANVTGLDYLGIPVVMSVRPNSYNLSVYQGKGLSLDAAKASAIMEAYEFACAEAAGCGAIWASPSTLERSCRIIPRNRVRSRLRMDVEIPWVAGADLISGRSVLIPEETITTDYRVPQRRGHGIFQSISNGLASGNTDDEAVLHAMCELIERDALALWKLGPERHRATTRVDPRQSADASVQTLMDRYEAAKMRVEMWEITSDIDVPAFFCIIDDAAGEPPFLGRFGGGGCHPSVDVAICRALAEAAQSRLTFIVGTRDDLPIDSYALVGWQRSIANLIADQRAAQPATGQVPRVLSFDADSIEADVGAVLTKLSARGIDCVARIDLTPGAIGLPCVRLVIPDLEGMSNKAGYRPGKRARRAIRAWS
jgi:ribosomal protein S12 methylthiotransferase accessory factor